MSLLKLFLIFTFTTEVTLFAQTKDLLGAGATFPYPLYSKMFYEYNKKTGIRTNYQPIGSGGGIKQLKSKTVDFGATDAFISNQELKDDSLPILHIPMCLGAVVITYNLPGVTTLKISPDVLAKIFLGTLTVWNDSSLLKSNPNMNLPAKSIVVVHRSDGSGTTSIFTDYLSKVNQGWKEKVGMGKSVNWPVGIGGKGNEGVSGYVKQIPGSIGYTELAYTIQNKMPVALIENRAGNFMKPSLESTSKAAEVAIPSDTRISITNTESQVGYPIAGFTWIIVYKEQHYGKRTKDKALELLNLLSWMIHEGQQFTSPLDYAPLPPAVVGKAEAIIQSITYDGLKVQQ